MRVISAFERRLLPEWAEQAGVLLTWPHPQSDWAGMLERIEADYIGIARAISQREALVILCYDEALRDRVVGLLGEAGVDLSHTTLALVQTNDTWIRDYGPITVEEAGKLRLLDFQFNAWGGKYGASNDDQANERLAARGLFALPLERVDLILEGGSIETDGEGTLLTTSRCLQAPTRNADLPLEVLEARLMASLGLTRILWLRHGALAGDDTDSHIDTLARFASPSTICYVACDDPEDEHFSELKRMEEELRAFRDHEGQPYRLIPLPWPKACFNAEGERLPATYANFLIVNGAVLVPLYDDPADATALLRLQEAFPHHAIIGLPCRALIEEYGSLHCATMQLPQGVLRQARGEGAGERREGREAEGTER